MAIRLRRTKTFVCAYHDLWGTRQELIAHHLKHNKECTILQKLEYTKVPNKIRVGKPKPMSPKRIEARRKRLLGI